MYTPVCDLHTHTVCIHVYTLQTKMLTSTHILLCVWIIYDSGFNILFFLTGIKKYIVGLVIKLSSTSESLEVNVFLDHHTY